MPAIEGTLIFGVPGVAISVITGLAAGWVIGKWTEYSTSDQFKPTQDLAAQAETGPATIIISGIADGMLSVWVPVIVVCVASMLAFGFANGGRFHDIEYFSLGLYGIGIAAVGMLSTLGITLATDAYGPIADNAGGNAEMAGLPEIVRSRTDALDSLGNTTAATGKGFAIGSAALTALALLAAYVESVRDGFVRWSESTAVEMVDDGFYKLSPGFVVERRGESIEPYLLLPTAADNFRVAAQWRGLDYHLGPIKIEDSFFDLDEAIPRIAATKAELVSLRAATLRDFTIYYDATLMNPRILIGVFMGSMATFVFCALTMKAVGRAAQGMVIEVRRQLRENPGIIDGTSLPDYERPVELSTRAAQRAMIVPSLLGLLLPIAVGLVLGVGGVLGLLAGSLTTGFCLAIFMANSGGAWDNAKKYIEAGNLGGKGSAAHKAAVVGDTVGDPFKDTSGPSLNILIKLMSMVSVVAAGLVVRYSLVSLGWL
jgi:inorganic pyrophosphatase/K(+)-stimulated pyrophosphate-energized sodium pump